jgi:hypothetical protein
MMEIYHLEDLEVDERVILGRILKKWDGWVWPGFIFTSDRDQWRALVGMIENQTGAEFHGLLNYC